MASSLAGLGSSIDINGLITKLMAVERTPIDTLAKKTTTYQSELSAYGSVKSQLASLQSAASALQAQATGSPASASSSDSTVAAASALSGAKAAMYSLDVQALAKAQKLYSTTFPSSSATLGSGSLTIERGRTTNGAFAADASATPVTITIDPAKSTLADVRDAINAASAGVTASIVNDGSGSRLVMTSADTGAGYGMKITASDADGNNTDSLGLSRIAFDPAATAGDGLNLTEAQAAQDAAFTLDGLPMTRSTNSIADAIDNVTITLAKKGSTSVTVAPDNTAVRNSLDAFVKTYNSAASTLKNLTSYDSTTKTGSILIGEATIRSIQAKMRSIITASYGASGATYASLSAIGVSFQTDGTLAVNSTKYSAALAAKPAELGAILGGGAKSMVSTLTSTLDENGAIAARTSGLQKTITQIADQKSRLEDRMGAIEARYRKQFSALDALVSSSTATSSYLTTQFDNLVNTSKK